MRHSIIVSLTLEEFVKYFSFDHDVMTYLVRRLLMTSGHEQSPRTGKKIQTPAGDKLSCSQTLSCINALLVVLHQEGDFHV